MLAPNRMLYSMHVIPLFVLIFPFQPEFLTIIQIMPGFQWTDYLIPAGFIHILDYGTRNGMSFEDDF